MGALDHFLPQQNQVVVQNPQRVTQETYPILYYGSTQPDYYAIQTNVEEWSPAANAWVHLYHFAKMYYPNGTPVH